MQVRNKTGNSMVRKNDYPHADDTGLYCGYCYLSNINNYAVINGKDENVYWCNKEGGCDSFGKRNSCADYKGPCDGRDSG